jgi:hypothetical protein
MIIYVFKKHDNFFHHENRLIFLNYMGKIVRAGAGAAIFDKLEPEPELEPDKMDRLRITAVQNIYHGSKC